MRKAPLRLLIGCVLLFFFDSLPGYPNSRTTSLPVSVNVTTFVSVTSTTLNFGSLAPGSKGTSSALITVRASKKTIYHITLDAGLNYQPKTRMMLRQGGTDTIPYTLWTRDKHPREWGDAHYAATYPYGSSVKAIGNGKDQVFDVMAKCQLSTLVLPGTYRDIVTITVHY